MLSRGPAVCPESAHGEGREEQEPWTYIGIRHTVERVTLEEPEDILFTEIHDPSGLTGVSSDEAGAARVT